MIVIMRGNPLREEELSSDASREEFDSSSDNQEGEYAMIKVHPSAPPIQTEEAEQKFRNSPGKREVFANGTRNHIHNKLWRFFQTL